jgi:CheY-like chemotaxis protein
MGATGVLIVEDDEPTREVLVELLTDAGYTIYQAPGGQPALERLRTHPEGLVVLLDLMMPGVDGFKVLQAVAAESPLATHHTYILMSAVGKTLPLHVVNLLKQLNVACVTKPFDVEELLAAVEKATALLPKPPVV